MLSGRILWAKDMENVIRSYFVGDGHGKCCQVIFCGRKTWKMLSGGILLDVDIANAVRLYFVGHRHGKCCQVGFCGTQIRCNVTRQDFVPHVQGK